MTQAVTSILHTKKKKLPIIKQAQFSECGYACVAMIGIFHGHDIDLTSLRHINEPSINGSSMLDLMSLLEAMKLESRAIRVSLEDLKHIPCPAILHWNMNHFVVLKSVGKKYAIIHDPATGKRKVSVSELSASFTGIVLEVAKANDFSCISARNKFSVFDLFKNIQGLTNSLAILFLLSLVIEFFVLLNPLYLQYVTDNITNSSSFNNLYVIAFGFILLTICHASTEYMRSHFVVYLTNKLSEYFSSGVMNHLLRVPFEYFERRHKGDILSRFHAIHEIQSKITTDFINSFLDVLVIVMAIVIMAIYSIQLMAMVVMGLMFYFLLRVAIYYHHKNQTMISVGEHANENSKFLEIIHSIMSIKLYAKESAMYRDWKNCFIKAMNADIKIARVNNLYSTANIFLFNIEHILVVSVGAMLVMTNQFSVGMLIAFLAYRQTVVTKSAGLIHKIFDYKLMSIQVDRVADILQQPIEQQDSLKTIDKKVSGTIRVQELAYKYSGQQNWLMQHITFVVHQGEKVAITGPSGIGKTTLLKIILGLLTPTTGQIFIDDIPLSVLGATKYREICATVMQDDTLISGSILDNITFGENKVDLDKVYEVAKIAQIHDDIFNMKMHYETYIGDMGNSLSGGQKQRILIARALYKNPKILFLDEATSHLDVDTEIKINQALKQLNITQIIIAHREDSIKMADRVIHLGKV